MRRSSMFFLIVSLLVGLTLAACGGAPAAAPAAAPEAAAPAASGPVVNRLGITLPGDALPIEQQVFRYPGTEATYMTWDASVYDENDGDNYGWADSCVRPDKDFDPQPNICESWSVSDDGLVWTFNLQQDKVWSDGVPLTANDFVFTFQRYARPDYDFEWFYSMMGIKNWAQVVSGELPPEELGVKAVDDHTLTIETDYPVPYLIRIMADAWVVPQHIVKDRLDDGTWALKPENFVSAGPFVLESYERGRRLTFVANEKYTGPYPPLVDKVIVEFMDPQVRFAAYKSGELDAVGGGYTDDLPPSAMAEIMANPDLQKELISWPNFITYYLFFDTWNEPFDNLLVRQAFSHAIDRDRIVNGPLQYQAVAAYSMNPPGFPGEDVAGLKDVQAFDPAKAKQLLADAGYPDGAGFPRLTLYTRQANPALTNAAEAIASMLKANLNIDVEIQNLDYGSYMDALRAQKRNQSGNFLFAMVPYEFDFVDGSNMLSVWGGCENPDAPLSQMPGRHTWYNQEYNNLLCEAGQILGDENRRNELYRQAERILVEDAALVPIYHGIFNALVKPYMKGAMFEPNSDGQMTWNRFRFSSRESQIYKSNSSR